jgi:hypothetical protein
MVTPLLDRFLVFYKNDIKIAWYILVQLNSLNYTLSMVSGFSVQVSVNPMLVALRKIPIIPPDLETHLRGLCRVRGKNLTPETRHLKPKIETGYYKFLAEHNTSA